MGEPLTKEEREDLWRRSRGIENALLRSIEVQRLLLDLERAEAERDEWRDVAKCEGENEEHERELVMRAEKAERERDEWAETARNEMAGRAAAEAGIRATLAERDEFCLDNDKHMAEVARLRDIISPGDAAAYEQGMAALQAKLAALERDYAEAQDKIIALETPMPNSPRGFGDRVEARARLARIVEIAEVSIDGLIHDAVEIRGSWADFDGRDNLRNVQDHLRPLQEALAIAKGEK